MPSAYLLYDDGCGPCSTAKDLVARLDTRHEIESFGLSTPRARQLAAALDEEAFWSSMHVVTADGRTLSAGDALTELLRILPVSRPIGTVIAKVTPAQGAVDALYALAVKLRGGPVCDHRHRRSDG